jgi:hypothetical protein
MPSFLQHIFVTKFQVKSTKINKKGFINFKEQLKEKKVVKVLVMPVLLLCQFY